MNIRFKHFLMGMGVCLILFLLFFFSFGVPILGAKPDIHTLEPFMVSPGDSVVLKGSGFGRLKHRSRILIAGQSLTSASVTSWSDREIVFIAPDFNRSTMISVRTLKGESPARVLINAADFPVIMSDPLLPGYPYISFVNPQSGSAGSVMEIHGQNFGVVRNRSKILVPRVENTVLELLAQPDEKLFSAVRSGDILYWSDRLLRVRLPDDAVTGPVLVATPQGYSNPFTVELERQGFTVIPGKTQTYTVRQEFGARQVAAYPGNSLYLWLPLPVESRGQRRGEILSLPEDFTGLSGDNCLLVRRNELTTGTEYRWELESTVSRQGYRIEVQPWLIPAQYGKSDAVQQNLGILPDMSRESFDRYTAAAWGVIRGEAHPFGRARMIYLYLYSRYKPDPLATGHYADGLPAEGEAVNARTLSCAFVAMVRGMGIPARPVSGVKITEQGEDYRSEPHTWAEFYLEGAGWFPVDPWWALQEKDAEAGWGRLDSERIAFSHGWSDTPALQPEGRFWTADNYSLQRHYGETGGNTGSLLLKWFVPTVENPD